MRRFRNLSFFLNRVKGAPAETRASRSGIATVQRDVAPAGADPNDLGGTLFKNCDPKLKKKLADTNFRGGEALAVTLEKLSNEKANALARVEAMLSEKDPKVWDWVAKIRGGRAQRPKGSGRAARLRSPISLPVIPESRILQARIACFCSAAGLQSSAP